MSSSAAQPPAPSMQATPRSKPVWDNRAFLGGCILLMILVYGFASPSAATSVTSITSRSPAPSS